MAKPDGTQMEVPGMPPRDLSVAVQATNEAVALVEEAKGALRRAQAAERLARRLEAEARGYHNPFRV